MSDFNRSGPDAHAPAEPPAWEIIADVRTPDATIIMRFADPDTARAQLLAIGFHPTPMTERAPITHDQQSASAFIHSDGSRVVLARRRFIVV